MSNWIRVTIASPYTFKDQANALAGILGFSKADEQTFSNVLWEDADGIEYVVASTLAKEAFITDAQSPLVLPEWGGDLHNAQIAQSMLSIYEEGADIPFANPDEICVVLFKDGAEAIRILGLKPVNTIEE